MRYIGAGLLLVGCTWLGFALAGRLSRRAADLEQVTGQLTQMRGHIVHLGMPLPEAMGRAGGRFADAQRILEGDQALDAAQALNQALLASALTESDVHALCGYVAMMQSMHRQECAQVMDGAIEEMQARQAQAREKAKKDGSLARTLGLCAGAALAVLLL